MNGSRTSGRRTESTSDLDEGLYVQFGCGSSHPQGWLNFDASPGLRLRAVPLIGQSLVTRLTPFASNVHFGDIVAGLPVPPDSVAAVFSSHVIEHLRRESVPKAFCNVHRILKPGGVFRSVLPDISKLAKAYIADDDPEAGVRFVSSTGLVSPLMRGWQAPLRHVLGHSEHKWMWDFRGLRIELQRAGFTDIREAEYGDSQVKAIRQVEERSRFEFAVCFEARK